MSRILQWLARLTNRRPLWVLAGATILLVIAAAAAIRRLELRTDLTSMFPRRHPIARVARDAAYDFGSFEFILAVVEARQRKGEDYLIEVAPEIAAALDDRRFFNSVDYKLDPNSTGPLPGEGAASESDNWIVNLLTDADWDSIAARLQPDAIHTAMIALRNRLKGPLTDRERNRLLEDPLNLGEIIRERLTVTSGPAKLNLQRGFFLSSDRRMLLMILKPAAPASDLAFCQNLREFLDDTNKGLIARHPEWDKTFHMYFVGAHIQAVENMRKIQDDIMTIVIASILGIAALFYLAYRRAEVYYLVGVPLIYGLVWTLGLTASTLQHLTIVTAALGGLFVGLGVDYGFLLYNRFLYELRKGRNVEEATEIILMNAGPGIITGALTTAAGFLGMSFSSFVAFQELGLVAAYGVICCLVAMLLILPSLLVLQLSSRAESVRRRPLLTLGLPQIADMVLTRPRTTVIVGVLLTVYFGWQAGTVAFDIDLLGLQETGRRYSKDQLQTESRFKAPSSQIVAIVEGDTLEQALEHNDRLYDNIQTWQSQTSAADRILSIDSLRTHLPSAQTQRRSQERLLQMNIKNHKKLMQSQAREVGLIPRLLEPFFQRIDRITLAAERGSLLQFDRLNNSNLQSLVQRYVTNSSGRYRILTQIYTPRGKWDVEIPPGFLETLGKGIPGLQVTGGVVLASRLKQIVLRDLACTSLVVVAVATLILVARFRRFRDSFLALLPVYLSLIWTLGLWRLLNKEMNFLNIMVIPMILGIGIHSGLHLVERYREMGYRRMGLVIETTGRSLLLTSLTTMLGFGSFSLVHHRGIQEMGLLTLLGVGTNLLAAIVFLPATIRAIERGLTFDDWTPQELD